MQCLYLRCLVFLHYISKLSQTIVHHPVDSALRITPVIQPFARRNTGQDFDTLVNCLDRIYVKHSLSNSVDYLGFQHQIRNILVGHENSLLSRQITCLADIEIPFNLLVDSTDRLNFSLLIHRPGYSQILSDRLIGKRREYCVYFRR